MVINDFYIEISRDRSLTKAAMT
ncbi:hypothetical protein MTBPR1_40126 [Candidatus Terasakiella magnetica]|uniref:Uncharacterized protein n=1 Tax=Candidatus Terasakiella magnetica TaxID=1867952 RepID=A0A1C3RIM1_9PROT|nr:hypothetical protein MTBPR1_40126 [Candidatus Terasakiella magnetica]